MFGSTIEKKITKKKFLLHHSAQLQCDKNKPCFSCLSQAVLLCHLLIDGQPRVAWFPNDHGWSNFLSWISVDFKETVFPLQLVASSGKLTIDWFLGLCYWRSLRSHTTSGAIKETAVLSTCSR